MPILLTNKFYKVELAQAGMKRLTTTAVIIAFFLFILIGARDVSAATTCNLANQFIFGISARTNAHAASDSGYDFQICFDNYFKGSYSGPGGANRVIGLSGTTNAHAEDPARNSAGYSGVVYGDLKCEIRDAMSVGWCKDIPTPGRGCRIAFLSAETNAHVALGSGNHFRYSSELCCASSSAACKCNYDGVCDDGTHGQPNGETPDNCPDCDSLVNVCGDGEITGDEQCDCGTPGNWNCADNNIPGYDLDGKTCAEVVPGSSGTLSCYAPDNTNECRFDKTGCTVPDLGWCTDWDGTNFAFLWRDANGDHPLNACNDYNLLNVNPDWPGLPDTAWDFRKHACNLDCSNVAWNDPSLPPDASSASCNWTYTDNNQAAGQCRLVYDIYGHDCRVDVIDSGECNAESNTKTIKIRVTNMEGGPAIDCGRCPEDNPDNDGNSVNTCQQEVPCPKVLQLPFFNWKNFVAALILISVVYMLYVALIKKRA